MIVENVLIENKELNTSEKIDISLNDISKGIKAQLKKEFSGCKFSIRTQFYSGGCSLHISLMSSDFKVVLPFEEITENAFNDYSVRHYSREQIKKTQENGHHQLSEFCLKEYNKDVWNNGVFLTQDGFNLFKRVVEMTKKFNWDNSDSQIDYFDVNFYLHLNIGKWDKPFIDGK